MLYIMIYCFVFDICMLYALFTVSISPKNKNYETKQILIYYLCTLTLMINKVLNNNSIPGVWKYGTGKKKKYESSGSSFTFLDRSAKASLKYSFSFFLG